jgi:hypothetical protein
MMSVPEVKPFRDRDEAVLVWLREQRAGFDLQNHVAKDNFRGDDALIDGDPSIIIRPLRASMSPRLRCASPQKPQPLQHLLYAWGEQSRRCLDPWELPHGDAIDDIRAVEGDKHSGEPKRKMWQKRRQPAYHEGDSPSHSTAAAERVEHSSTTGNACPTSRTWRRSASWPREACDHLTSGSVVRPQPCIPA